MPLWTNRYSGKGTPSFDFANAVAVDGSNNVIVTGGASSFAAYATIKYSAAGVPLWTNLYGTIKSAAMAMALDGSNNVIVTGYSARNGRDSDYATIKYSSAGVPLWTNRYNGPGNTNDSALAVAVDGNNDVIVTGYSAGSETNDDYATLKYSSAGVPLWTNRYDGPANYRDWAKAVAVDGNNDVIVTGYSYGSGSSGDYATLKYSSAGVPLWTNRYNGPGNGHDEAYAVAVDGSNNVIVTGSSYGSGSSADYATIKYSSAGVPLWTNRYNGPGNGNDYARAVAVDGSGYVIVTGHSTGTGGNYDFATMKYMFPLVITGSRLTGGTFEMLVDNLQPGTLVIEACDEPGGLGARLHQHHPHQRPLLHRPGRRQLPDPLLPRLPISVNQRCHTLSRRVGARGLQRGVVSVGRVPPRGAPLEVPSGCERSRLERRKLFASGAQARCRRVALYVLHCSSIRVPYKFHRHLPIPIGSSHRREHCSRSASTAIGARALARPALPEIPDSRYESAATPSPLRSRRRDQPLRGPQLHRAEQT